MTRRLVWLVGALTALGPACTERLSGPGSCPDYCTVNVPQFTDSLIFPVTVGRDSSYRGYVRADETSRLQLAEVGTTLSSRALLEYTQLPDSVTLGTEPWPIIGLDSLRLQFALVSRDPNAEALRVDVYHLLPGLDTGTTYDDVLPDFVPSNLVTSMVIDTLLPPDSTSGDRQESGTLVIVVPGSAIELRPADSGVVALGLTAAADTGVPFVVLGSAEGLTPAVLSLYVAVDSAGDTTSAVLAPPLEFDSFVLTPTFGAPVELEVAGVPSARSILRFTFPEGVVDTSRLSRATLLLVPAEPAFGVTGDTMTLAASAVAVDLGAKSPLVPDSIFRATARVAVGSADTIAFDVTNVLRAWGGTPTFPRTMMLRVSPEGGLGAVRIAGTGSATLQPAMLVTFFRPYPFGER